MKFPKFNIYFFEVIAILLMGLIPLLWYKPGYVALGHDMGFPLAPVDYFQDRLFTWSDRIGSFGSNQTDSIPGVFIHGLEALAYSLGIGLIHAQQLTFIFWFTLPGITMYILLRSLHPERDDYLIRLIGSLFYMVNHYLLQGWMIAERSKFSIVAAMPLIVLIIFNVILKKKNILKQSMLLAIILFFLNGGAGIPLWGGLMLASFCTMVMVLIYSVDPWIKKLIRAFSFIILSISMFIAISIFWVYPYFISSFSYNIVQRLNTAGGVSGAIGWSHEISKNASIINILRMQGIPDWYDNAEHPYSHFFLDNPLFILLSLIFPIIALTALRIRLDEDKQDIFLKICFFVLLIVAIPFVAGSHPPFGVIYDSLLREIPGFSIFRTPFYKFGMVIWFAYAYLFAVGLNDAVKLISARINMPLMKLRLIFLSAFILILVIYNFPAFTGSFFKFSKDFSTMVQIPNYIFDAKKKLDENKFSTRILLLPELNNFHEEYNWGYFSLSTVASMLSRRPVVINDVILVGTSELKITNSLYDQLREKGSSRLIDFLGVDGIFTRGDYFNEKNLDYYPQKTLRAFEESNSFAKTSVFGQWNYYSVKDSKVKPLISAPNGISIASVNNNDVDKIFEIPNFSIGNSFVLQDPKIALVFPYLDDGSSLALQAICTNCPNIQEQYSTEFSVPRILPGTRLYFLAKLLGKNRRSKISDPIQRIEFDLESMGNKSGALWVLVRERNDYSQLKSIISEWENLLEDIKRNYQQITVPYLREDYSHKIYYLLRYILFKNQELRGDFKDTSDKEVINQFREYINQYIQETGISPVYKPPHGTPSHYEVQVPKEGKYRISLYTAQDFNLNQKNIELNINNEPINLNKFENLKWYVSEPIQFSRGHTIIDFPKEDSNYKDLATQKNFKIEAEAGRSNCMDIPIGKIDPQDNYIIKFNSNYISGTLPILYIYEINSEFPQGVQKRGIGDEPIGNNRDREFSKLYKPSKFTESVFIRLCTDAEAGRAALTEITNFQFLANSPSSMIFLSLNGNFPQSAQLEFKALNQTKYLIRINGNDDKMFIDFNSRFDNNWKLREIDPNISEKNFFGDKKEYWDRQVIEYAREDKHIITDLIYPKKNENEAGVHIQLNSFSNGWVIDKSDNNSTRTFLLEYQSQNDLYKVTLISLFLILALGLLFLGLKLYERRNY